MLEKVLCHAGTHGLAISINDQDWIAVPESPRIPAPQWEYQHHCYPIIPVPLSQLQEGRENQFRLRVDAEHSWDWPQNLIYGVHLRIYYDSRQKPHTAGRLAAPLPNSVIGDKVLVQVQPDEPVAAVRRIDLIGCYDGVNWEGDGSYRQWHYH